MCSQVLHHFSASEAAKLLREMDRVARVRVVVSDLRRSWIAAAGLWLVSFPLRFHAVSRHDGVVSVMRGFTPEELADTVKDAVARKASRAQASWIQANGELGSGTAMTGELARAFDLGPMPIGRPMETVDERIVRATVKLLFELARNVEAWPSHLPHYRYVRFRERRSDGGGLVEMSAVPPVSRHRKSRGPPLRINWPTWWLSEMAVDSKASDPLSPRRGYYERDGRRVDVSPHSRRHARTNRAFMGWATDSTRGHVGGEVRHRPGVRAWNRVPHSGGAGGGRRARSKDTVVKRGLGE